MGKKETRTGSQSIGEKERVIRKEKTSYGRARPNKNKLESRSPGKLLWRRDAAP